MQTGEGKTLAAVMPAALRALEGKGAHVLTFNDYLARRDAEWMGPVYARLGLSVGFVQQGMTPEERRHGYLADVTYVTAKEAGFDHLRDLQAMDRDALVHRPFHFALVDEADSILIDEARVPLVIAGSVDREISSAPRLAALVASTALVPRGKAEPVAPRDRLERLHLDKLTDRDECARRRGPVSTRSAARVALSDVSGG